MSETAHSNPPSAEPEQKVRWRFWRWLGWTALALLLVVAAVLVWALGTNAGARTLLGHALPANLSVNSVEGRLWGSLRLRGVRFNDPAAVVELAQLSLVWQPQSLLSKSVRISQLQLQGVKVQLLSPPAAAPVEPSKSFALPEKIALPVDFWLEELLLLDVQVQQAERRYAIDRAGLQASLVDQQLRVQGLEVFAGEASIALQGDALLAGDYPIEITAAIKALDPSAIDASWSPLQLDAAAQVQGPLLDPQGLVTLVALLPDQPEPVSFRVEGGVQAYSYSAQSRWHRGNRIFPITLVGTGNLEATQVQLLQLVLEQDELPEKPAMQLAVRGDLSWLDGINGAFALDGTGLDPAAFADELTEDPASGLTSETSSIPKGDLQLGARVDISTSTTDELNVAVDELLVTGTLGTLPLEVAGQVQWSPQQLQIEQLRGVLGSSQGQEQVQWQVQGEIAQHNNLTWSFEAQGLDEVSAALGLAPQDRVQGQIKGSGFVRGSQENPRLLAEIEGRQLAYQGRQVETLQVSLKGTKRAHDFTLTLKSPELQADLALTGDLQADGRWRFLANQLEVAATVAEESQVWRLREPASGWFNQGQFALRQTCLTQAEPASSSALCLSASNPKAQIVADVELSAFDLRLLNSLLPPQVRVRGLLAGAAHWGGEPMLSRGEFQLNGLAVAVAADDTKSWQDVLVFDPGQLSITTQTDALLLQVDLPIGTDGVRLDSRITGSALRSPDLAPNLWPVQGSLNIQLPQLAWLGAFSPEVDLTDASVQAQLALSGVLGEPQLDGDAQLQVASVLLNTPDIRLQQTQLQMTGTTAGLELRGSTSMSGEPVQLAVDVSWLNELRASGSLQGHNLLVSDSTTALVRVSPDLTFDYQENLVKVRGRVVVPSADIRLQQVPSGAITVTPDQVLVDSSEVAEVALPVDLDARLDIELGDEVRFSGLGLEAQFSGKLKVQQEPKRLARGTGEINITQGSYSAYGQNLNIERGRLIFAGGVLTEPGLDVRAVRQATPDVAVGVDVRGSLADPRLTLFSTPALPESDQLSYLVLGRPMSGGTASERSVLQQAALALGVKGGKLITERLSKSLAVDNIGIESAPGEDNDQAALVIGKYLSPKLYVSYGYGLFEPISTLRLEYQLSRLWRIVTESTNQAAGGDFEWVLEK